jgi:molybdopterin-containing oxidoreductase family iron-sulfur binding subunit
VHVRIQRIEDAKIARLVEAGARNKNEFPIREFKTACQQACPSNSLVFGNINDSGNAVSQLRQKDRAYVMLKYLNTQPRVSYLARIKNPNSKMPGAAKVGMANGEPHGHPGAAASGHEPSGEEAAEHMEAKEEADH